MSQLFGGLDLCAVEVVQEKSSGNEFILTINDCTMKFFPQTQEEDCQILADLIVHQMEIYSRPDRPITIHT